jgi:hypothetical protein
MKDGAITLVILIINTKKRQKLKKGAYFGVRGY